MELHTYKVQRNTSKHTKDRWTITRESSDHEVGTIRVKRDAEPTIAFMQMVERVLMEHGAKRAGEQEHCTLRVDTLLGPLVATIYSNRVALRFEGDLRPAKQRLGKNRQDFNHHSGKWNFHAFEISSEPDSLTRLESSFRNHLRPAFEPYHEKDPDMPYDRTTPKRTAIDIQRGGLRALLKIMCADVGRPGLRGIFVGKHTLAATGEHAMLVLSLDGVNPRDAEHWADGRWLSAEDAQAIVKAMPRRKNVYCRIKRTQKAKGQLSIAIIDPPEEWGDAEPIETLELGSHPANGNPFTNAGGIIPTRNSQDTGTAANLIGYGAPLMARVFSALQDAGGDCGVITTRLSIPSGPHDPLRVDLQQPDQGGVWTAVVMPVRI